MKTFGQQVLILGGFYFIISFLFSLGSGVIFEALNMIMFVAFMIMFVVLCFKRKYEFLTRFQNKFVKSSKYLFGLGVVQYFEILFITLPGIVYGYKASEAQYNGLEAPVAPLAYLQIVGYVYWSILCLALVFASYWNFRKSKTEKSPDCTCILLSLILIFPTPI